MLTVGSLFSGIGLLDYGLHLAGLRHAWFCEREADRRAIIELRWPGTPVFADVCDVRAGTAERVDVIAGGFPCRGASSAGQQQGFGHPETVLWREMARAVRELRPRHVLVENVANILSLRPPGGEPGDLWTEVLGTLATLGYDVEWDCIPAAAVGAPHRRDRVFAVATDATSIGAPCAQRHRRERGEPVLDVAGDHRASADAAGARSQGPGVRGRSAEHGGTPSTDSEGVGCDAGLGRPRAASISEPSQGAAASTDADGAGWPPGRVTEPAGQGSGEPGTRIVSGAGSRGVPVRWGPFGAAIDRWESVVGRPAPEPLVRRVDDRGAARVERSQLSALGDGVQVQVGLIVGSYVMSLSVEAGSPSAGKAA